VQISDFRCADDGLQMFLRMIIQMCKMLLNKQSPAVYKRQGFHKVFIRTWIRQINGLPRLKKRRPAYQNPTNLFILMNPGSEQKRIRFFHLHI